MIANIRTQPSGKRPPGTASAASVTGLPGRRAEDAGRMIRIRDFQNRDAFSELSTHYAPRLKAWLMHRGEQAATCEDIIQDVLVTVWLKAASFNSEKASFSTWVFRLTRNKWIDHKRKHDRLQPTEQETLQQLADGPVNSVDCEYDQVEAARAVHQELALLPAGAKNMLHLSFFEGLSHGEIAQRTGLPLGTVKSRIRAPLQKLQTRLHAFRDIDS